MPRLASWGIITIGALCGLLAGCRTEGDAAGAPRLRLAHVYELSAPSHAFGAARLPQKLVEAGADLKVSVFPAAQLGREAELLEQLVAGELEMAIAGPSFLAMWHEPIGLFDAAYAFRDTDHLLEVSRGPAAQAMWDELRERYGVRVLDTWFYGLRHLTSNRPIRHPDDLAGFRLRMPDARIWQASGQALGASPMPIAFAEVYLALQQGIADGQENPISTIQAMGFHEVQGYLNLTGHIQSSIQILIAERVWRRLSREAKEALLTSVGDLGAEVREGIERSEREILNRWRSRATLEVIEDLDVEAFRRRARAHFSQGFDFSELYREITADESPPQEKGRMEPFASENPG